MSTQQRMAIGTLDSTVAIHENTNDVNLKPSQADLLQKTTTKGGIMRKPAIVLIPLLLAAFALGLIGCGDEEVEGKTNEITTLEARVASLEAQVEGFEGITDVEIVMLDPDANASATLVGGTLTLYIPRGEQGEPGVPGPMGPSGP